MGRCPNCGVEHRPDASFCASCGTALERLCPNGHPVAAHARFCDRCGAPLDEQAAPAPEPATERRLVSVLFADLVGFTGLSAGRDSEDVRELLSRYFDTCRRLIDLYGGSVEKFIGDAVMAVWGVPVVTEDDAERAVRAALDLVTAVGALGEQLGVDLKARAGVLTGEATVTLGATGEGMVAGDLVNTASRVQSVAEPGTVLVGETTRRASEQTVVYEPVGSFELKGKEGETELWRALRVVSGRAGSLKSQGLEAPFVGRDRELRQIKDLFHASADERRAQLASVTGISGIGKSRLGWEFYKYFDGIEQVVYWHRGRCLAYGEGVTYWALADMVRMRCGIAEDDDPAVASEKLQAALDEHLLEPDDRHFVQPRLQQLLGLGGSDAHERQDLFAAWRLFFERLSDVYPTVLLFEDMQWADSALLDFVEHVLDWSRNHPIFVITLARPELLEKRPTWGAGQRNFASLYLEPLPVAAMSELLAGLVPGLPTALRDQILQRAEGVPLYAVETVRMLLDRGLLAEQGSSYAVVGEVESLAVPETLQAVAAARLDTLSPDERRLVQDASVLGKTFTAGALSALTRIEPQELDALLTGLVRKELLGLQTDPRSPENGQYGFLQDLIRQVAYDTLARRDRRARHLAAAEYLAATLGEEEVAEVIASHLLDAYRLDEAAADAPALRARAHRALLAAAERAASLGATMEASLLFEQAAELADQPSDEAAALFRAGEAAMRGGSSLERAASLLERAEALYEQAGDSHAAARIAGMSGTVDAIGGNIERAIARLERAYETIKDDEPDGDMATLLIRLGVQYFFAGDMDRAAESIERGLEIAEALGLPDVLSRGWNGKAMVSLRRRPEEARGLFELALAKSLEHELLHEASTVAGNLSDIWMHRDGYVQALAYMDQGLSIARRVGNRRNEWSVLSEQTYALTMLGRWDEAFARLAELPDDQLGVDAGLISPTTGPLEVYLHRGSLVHAQRFLARFDEFERSTDRQAESAFQGGLAAVRLAEGRPREALAAAEVAIGFRDVSGLSAQAVKQGLRHGLEAAIALGEPDTADRLLRLIESTPVGLRPPYLAALAERYRGRLAGDDPAADRHFAAAVSQFGALELPFDEAVVSLEYGEWLLARGRADEAAPLLETARETFGRLGATPWLERLDERATVGERAELSSA